jgi:hypothetical protein
MYAGREVLSTGVPPPPPGPCTAVPQRPAAFFVFVQRVQLKLISHREKALGLSPACWFYAPIKCPLATGRERNHQNAEQANEVVAVGQG